jgi:hypothetical protein
VRLHERIHPQYQPRSVVIQESLHLPQELEHSSPPTDLRLYNRMHTGNQEITSLHSESETRLVVTSETSLIT